MFRESFAVLERRRRAILKRIAQTGPFIMATATYPQICCGNPKCKCAKDKSARHKKMHLSWADAQGSGTQYVPVGLHKEVLRWIENYWTIKEYMKEMTLLSRRMIKVYSASRGKSGPKTQAAKKKD